MTHIGGGIGGRLGGGVRIAPAGMPALNRAFDVTPAALVSAIVTERGIARPPYSHSLAQLSAWRPGYGAPR